VVGASGYLGGRIAEYLSVAGNEVTVFMRRKPDESLWCDKMSNLLIGDLRDSSTFSTLMVDKFDAVVYLVSLNHTLSEKSVDDAIATNVTPMWELLENLTKNGLSRFLYFSTQQIYGQLPPEIIEESRKPAPHNNYGLTHLMCENIGQFFNQKSDTKCINLRLSNGYGRPSLRVNDCWGLVINDLCKSAIEKHKICLLSDGSPQRDFIHLSDICQALSVLLSTSVDQQVNTNYHLASGTTYTILELAQIVGQCYLEKFDRVIPIILPDGHTPSKPKYTSDVQKFQYSVNRLKALGFLPKVTLHQGIAEVFDYLT
jgi:UDP-glucose 4-epimerase